MENALLNFSHWLANNGKSKNTIQTYVGALNQFNNWLKAKRKSINTLTRDDIQCYMIFLEKEKKSASTIEKAFTSIHTFSRFSGRPELTLQINRKKKSKEKEAPASLNPSEQQKLFKKVESDGNIRNTIILYMLLQTGIKVSELCALNQEDIHFKNGKGHLTVRNHNGDIDRKIPLSKEICTCLKEYLSTLDVDNEALFISNINTRMSSRAVQYVLNKYQVHPNILRHTFCQKLINNGVDVQTVSMLAGYKDINMVKRYLSNINLNLEHAIEDTFSKREADL